MEIKGKVIAVLPLMSGNGQASGKEWSKQEYVIQTVDSEYPKKICFNLWGDRIKQFNIQMGELITVQVDIESREYNGRWYTDVKCWKVNRSEALSNIEEKLKQHRSVTRQQSTSDEQVEQYGELPF